MECAIQKLNGFRFLKHNWDSYGGVPPSHDTIIHGHILLEAIVIDNISEPVVTAGGDGAIQFEWDDFEMEFIVDENSIRYSYLICPTDDINNWEEGEFQFAR
jgi:hypothetical protein